MPARRLLSLLPKRLRDALERRVFYVIFNATRVTNDAYGWRPDPEDPKRETTVNRQDRQPPPT